MRKGVLSGVVPGDIVFSGVVCGILCGLISGLAHGGLSDILQSSGVKDGIVSWLHNNTYEIGVGAPIRSRHLSNILTVWLVLNPSSTSWAGR